MIYCIIIMFPHFCIATREVYWKNASVTGPVVYIRIWIIGISEIKLGSSAGANVTLTYLMNYSFINCDSPTRAGGVGLYIYSHVDFVVRPDVSLDVDGFESLWVEIWNCKQSNSPVIGIIIYTQKLCELVR